MEEFATVAGTPRCPTKTYGDIEYFRETLVCRVFNIVQDIPKFNNLFGRQIKCIHTGQAEQPNLHPNHTTTNTDNEDSDVASETDSSNDIDTGKDKKQT